VVDNAFVFRLALCLPRDAGGVRLVRLVLDTALAAVGVTATCRDEIAVALSEACTNVVRHARGSDLYEISVELTDRQCVIDVVDAGGGFDPALSVGSPPGDAEAGRGLHLIAAISDRFHLDTAPGRATTVRFAKRVTFRDPAAAGWATDGGVPRASS
jgi:serine/threonine-protein kinase RsbW